MFALLAAVALTALPVVPRRPALTAHVPLVVAQNLVRRVGAPAPATPLDLSLELPSRNESELEALTAVIDDRSSPYFHHYLSQAQFTARYGPSAADYAALVGFATSHGFQTHGFVANRRVLDVTGSVAAVERAFAVRIGLYWDPARNRAFYAPDREPTLDLATPVLHVAGLDDYVPPTSHHVRAIATGITPNATGSGLDGNFIGSDVRAAYYGKSTLTGAGQSVGLFEFGGYNPADIALYFKAVSQRDRVPIVGVSLGGANLSCTGSCDDSEQALDIEEAISMAPGLAQVVFYDGKTGISIINRMASDDSSAQLSCSWGFNPDDAALKPILAELDAQGQTFLVATGDYGYHLTEGGVWPADAALATAVGGTDLRTQGAGGPWASETGWVDSGGGPSPDGIPIPYYQKPFINAANAGSTTLRNVPDIAADANTDNYSCFDGGCYTGNGGTSYAAPLWAGFVALANERAARIGSPQAGFLNPTIYRIEAQSPSDYHDETSGFNGRYYAVPGYDLVTGTGSPNGTALIDALVGGG